MYKYEVELVGGGTISVIVEDELQVRERCFMFGLPSVQLFIPFERVNVIRLIGFNPK